MIVHVLEHVKQPFYSNATAASGLNLHAKPGFEPTTFRLLGETRNHTTTGARLNKETILNCFRDELNCYVPKNFIIFFMKYCLKGIRYVFNAELPWSYGYGFRLINGRSWVQTQVWHFG